MAQVRDPLAPITVFAASDPAFAPSSVEDKADYRRTLDRSKLKAIEGVRPIEAEIEPADAVFGLRQFAEVNADTAMLAFRACVRSIKTRDGIVHRPERLDPVESAKLASEDWLRKASSLIGGNRVLELGYAAISISKLAPESLDPLSLSPGPAPTS